MTGMWLRVSSALSARHVDVRQHQVNRRVLLQQAVGCLAVIGKDKRPGFGRCLPLERLTNQQGKIRLVVDHQDLGRHGDAAVPIMRTGRR